MATGGFIASTSEAVSAKIAADSGSGGLNSPSTPDPNYAYVRVVGTSADSEAGTDRTTNYPMILIDVVDGAEHAFETGADDYAGQGSLGVIRLHVYVDRDQVENMLDQVVTRARKVFTGATLTSTNGWSYSRCMNMREIDGPDSDKVAHRIVEFQVAANRS